MHPIRPRTRLRTRSRSRTRSVLLLPALMVAFAPGAATLLAPQTVAGQAMAQPTSASERRVIDHDGREHDAHLG